MSHSPNSRGRATLWLGLGLALIGPVLYVAQLKMGRTVTPWYLPALATLGAVMAFSSLRRRPTVTRALALVLVTLLAGFEWWFLAAHARLPAYTGPVSAGTQFPEFRAQLADGRPFVRSDLTGDRATALIFFRGRW
jgi:hypothetical protein